MASRAHHGALSRESGLILILIAIDSRAFPSARFDHQSLAKCNLTRMDICHAAVSPRAPSTAVRPRWIERMRDQCPTDRPSPRATRARSRVVAVDASARDDVERGSVSVLSHRFVSTRRRVPVRAPGDPRDGDGDVIVNGARDVDVDDDDESDAWVRRGRVETVRASRDGRVERVRAR